MNRIKRFNEEYSIPQDQEDERISVTVKDLIDFLSTLPPDATTDFHHGGWDYELGKTPLEIIKNSWVLTFDKEDNTLYFTN